MSGSRPLRLDPDEFLARYWQRQPLLVTAALAHFSPPVDADELAGLALEAEVDSRIVERAGDQWLLSHGPFSAEDFQRDNPWTLLVQSVDHYIPEVAALRQLADFIPQWRVDDIMVSYAVDGGSVGPHYDNYDVFLLQGEGRRRWRVGQHCDADSPLLPHEELRILRDFQCGAEYLLEPGDMLYLPPGVAHWGIAEGECMTLSIGFRAPRINDLVSRYADALLERIDPEQFYTDAGREPSRRAGEISREDLARVREQLQAAMNSVQDGIWLGELVTEPRQEFSTGEHGDRLPWPTVGSLEVAADGRLAWMEDGERIQVFANGRSRAFDAALAPVVESLCADRAWDRTRLAQALAVPLVAELLDYLHESECLYVE